MRLHRFFGRFDFDQTELDITEKTFVSQIRNVLRLAISQELILADGYGQEAQARIIGMDSKRVRVEILDVRKNTNDPALRAALYCSLLKKENFEWVCQKATEVGIARIVPLLAAHTVKQGFARPRLEKIIREAAEQSGRGYIPVLDDPRTLENALSDAQANNENFFFDASGKPFQKQAPAQHLGLFIGPEGGWSDQELARAEEHAMRITTLGTLTLRAETAAIVASYLVSHL